MAKAHAPIPDDDLVNLACFELSGQEYALPVANVREIVRIMQITPLPNAPGMIEGVIDLRGAVVPVLDLAKLLGRGTGISDSNARIVVLELEGLVFGLWVSASTDVLTLSPVDLEDVPALATATGYDVVRHVIRRADQAPVMVLSLDHLISAVKHSSSGHSIEGEATG